MSSGEARGRKAWMADRGEPEGPASTTELGGLSITKATGSCGTRQLLQLRSVWLLVRACEQFVTIRHIIHVFISLARRATGRTWNVARQPL
jgi:hypothetical protein